LWNAMWKADYIHDTKIVANVKEMQERCCCLLERLQTGIAQLNLSDTEARPKVLGAAPSDYSALRYV
jgi:hypothetical protein